MTNNQKGEMMMGRITNFKIGDGVKRIHGGYFTVQYVYNCECGIQVVGEDPVIHDTFQYACHCGKGRALPDKGDWGYMCEPFVINSEYQKLLDNL